MADFKGVSKGPRVERADLMINQMTVGMTSFMVTSGMVSHLKLGEEHARAKLAELQLRLRSYYGEADGAEEEREH